MSCSLHVPLRMTCSTPELHWLFTGVQEVGLLLPVSSLHGEKGPALVIPPGRPRFTLGLTSSQACIAGLHPPLPSLHRWIRRLPITLDSQVFLLNQSIALNLPRFRLITKRDPICNGLRSLNPF